MTRAQGLYVGYLAGAVLIAATVVLRFAMQGILGNSGSALMFAPAIMVASMLGGFWPGLLSTAGAAPFVFHFLQTGSVSAGATLNSVIFGVVGLAIA